MGVITESPVWENYIYQLEETDLVRGGDPASGGTSNVQAQQLAKRTSFLRNKLYAFEGIEQVTMNSSSGIYYEDIVNSLLLLNLADTGYEMLIYPDEMPIGAMQTVAVVDDYANAGKAIKIRVDGGTISGTKTDKTHVWLYAGESVTIVRLSSTSFYVMDSTVDSERIGDIVYSPRTNVQGLVAARGQVVNRNAFPRLFEAIELSAISDATWLSANANSGSFSLGNGSTTFRLPDLRGVFLRGLDSSRGLDSGRTVNSFQDFIQKKQKLFLKTVETQIYAATANNNVKVPVISNSAGTIGVTTEDVFAQENGTENAPVNIAYTAYIKY